MIIMVLPGVWPRSKKRDGDAPALSLTVGGKSHCRPGAAVGEKFCFGERNSAPLFRGETSLQAFKNAGTMYVRQYMFLSQRMLQMFVVVLKLCVVAVALQMVKENGHRCLHSLLQWATVFYPSGLPTEGITIWMS